MLDAVRTAGDFDLYDGTVDQMIKRYIAMGDRDAVEDMHRTRVKPNGAYRDAFPVATLARKYLAPGRRNKDKRVAEAMRAHLNSMYPADEVTWIYYFSFLMHGMTERAGALLISNAETDLKWPDSSTLYRLLLKPSTLDQLLSVMDVVVDQCGHIPGFGSVPLYMAPLYSLMERQRFDELKQLLNKIKSSGHELGASLRVQILNEFNKHDVSLDGCLLTPTGPLESFVASIGTGDFEAEIAALSELDSLPAAVLSTHLRRLTREQYQRSCAVVAESHPHLDRFAHPAIVEKHMEVLLLDTGTGNHDDAMELLRRMTDVAGKDSASPHKSAAQWRRYMSLVRRHVISTGDVTMLTDVKRWRLSGELKTILAANIKFVELSRGGEPFCELVKVLFAQNHELAGLLATAAAEDGGERAGLEMARAYYDSDVWPMYERENRNVLFNNFTAGLISHGFGQDLVTGNLERMKSEPNNFTSVFNKAIDNVKDIDALISAIALFERFGCRRAMNRCSVIRTILKSSFAILPKLSWADKGRLLEALDRDFITQVPPFINHYSVRYYWPMLKHALTYDAPSSVHSNRYQQLPSEKEEDAPASDQRAMLSQLLKL